MENNNDNAYQEWLVSVQSQSYQKVCRDIFLRFLKFLKEKEGFDNPTGDLILKQHKENRKSDDNKTKYYFDDLIPKFSQWLLENRDITHNSAVNLAVPIKGFFKYHREPLNVQPSDMTRIRETRKKFHMFTQDELSKMVRVGNIQEKAVILLGKDLGIRNGDFSALKRQPLLEAYKDQNGEFPIEFQIETEKEGVMSVGHVSEETWQALNDYWVNVPESEFIFPSNNGHIKQKIG